VTDLDDLYQEVILDHYKKPRNFGALAGANRRAEGNNPLCGDTLTLELSVEGDVIQDVRFRGAGCAISTASASLMTAAVKGKSGGEARKLFESFHAMVTGGARGADLGKLEAFAGVSDYPVRVKCASLCWHTLKAALDNAGAPVTTE
jgi:nitrogen fixation NifU-like protein